MLTYWFLSGSIPFTILCFYSFFFSLSERDSLIENIKIIIDYRFWISIFIAGLLGVISLIISIALLCLFIHEDIWRTKEKKKEFLEKTPWYQQKVFGGWKNYNSKVENDK